MECERAFSTLKVIKTRLRNALSEEHLEALMLMAVERDIVENLGVEAIIDQMALSSGELSRLLSLT